jgi:hypothetical protein
VFKERENKKFFNVHMVRRAVQWPFPGPGVRRRGDERSF